eukprot:CAMPEP_0178467906 /NCGR_PEP_ID=MMETSP0689_2-20121128/52650_1 /TAXON_ID=160604 /ORGANISM="Amphidinium massartii, Strain CS-259" /LENGTH=161 /DNA_ID=CAMNT_0020094955 /DNA_START=101 /DNA_END=586 /DNA_ORIENTATION=+
MRSSSLMSHRRSAGLDQVLPFAHRACPAAFLLASAICFALLIDASVLVFALGVGILVAAGGVGEVERSAAEGHLGQVARNLGRHFQAALARVHEAPGLMAPLRGFVAPAARVAVLVPRLTRTTDLCWVVDLAVTNCHWNGTFPMLEAYASALRHSYLRCLL